MVAARSGMHCVEQKGKRAPSKTAAASAEHELPMKRNFIALVCVRPRETGDLIMLLFHR